MTTERDQDAPDAAAEGTEQLRAQLEDEREKAKSYYQSWQRTAADFQNYKRRVEDERSETARLASAALIINLLPLLDDLERAMQSADAHVSGLTWFDGLRLIQRKFQALLEMTGVEEIAADGQMFDPSQHEAISQAPGEDNKVISVVQKGYRLGDRVIRPAMVVVGHGQGHEAQEGQGQ